MAPRVMNRKLQPDTHVLSIHILHDMKGSHASMTSAIHKKWHCSFNKEPCHVNCNTDKLLPK